MKRTLTICTVLLLALPVLAQRDQYNYTPRRRSVAAGGGSAIPTNGLISYWKLDSTNIIDYYAVNSGTSSSLTMTNGVKGLADTAIFIHAGSRAEVPHSDSLNWTNGTWSFWWRSTQNTPGVGILGKCNWASASQTYYFMMYNGDLYLSIEGTGGGYIGRHAIPGAFNDGAWHLLTATYDGGTDSSAIKIYKDAVQVDIADYASGTFTAPLTNTQPVYFGLWSGVYWSDNSAMDLARLYDRVLATNEIDVIYQEEKP